ncbi:ABC transporter permease [Lachnoclostridium sp. An181]|uniref:ABC transporter permease n=1 Tax=Lachnoclostridium sp. An181 TaxID=1965575 RepID=UPI000B3755E7|nr:ABC transporter permease [Lachnoclostridium sp. An181]OUP49197.1 ABC transporter permease [Lachnoclostridium sp. An181]
MKMITRLALNNNKKNKTRSILLMTAILLTTTLLAAIASFGYGNIKYQRDNAIDLYGNYYGSYVGVTEEQIQKLEQRGEIEEIGRAASAGEVENNTNISLAWMGDTALTMTNMQGRLSEGHFPKAEDEIAGEKALFEKLGYPDAKPGDLISLNFRRNNQEAYVEKTLVISGIVKTAGEEMENQGYTGYISEGFYNSCYSEKDRSYNAYFSLSDAVSVNSTTLEPVAKDLAKTCGINPEQTVINSYFAMWVLDPGMEMIVTCVVVAFIVLLFSLLVIYNIFQVGIAQKIQEYGKIKALGATRKQMRKLVFREGMILALPTIPAGLVVGTGITKIFLDYWLKENSASLMADTSVKFSVCSIPLLLLCALAAFLTVWAALKKPMRLVAKISPVEAIRFQENAKKSQGFRKGKRRMSVHAMMTANLAMNRKRTVTTIITMGLSCVLFVVAANFTGNVSVKYDARKYVQYGQFQIDLRYEKDDAAYPENNLDSVLKNNPLDEVLADEIGKIDGVMEVKTQNYLYAYDKDNVLHSICVMDQEQFDREVRQGSLKGEVDYDKASRENALIHGWSYFMEEEGYKLNETVQFELGSQDKTVEYSGKIMGAFGSVDADWVITEDTYKKLGFDKKSIGTIWVDCKDGDCQRVETEIGKLLEGKNHYEISTYKGALETSKSTLGMFETLSYAFLFLVGLIAFMNMANTIIISIITRKRELGVLQALGMTNRQLNGMLRNEGLLFTVGSILTSLLVGMPIGYALFLYGKEHGYFGLDVYHIPFAEIIGMILILAVMQLMLSYILSRNVKKESLVERIRYQE